MIIPHKALSSLFGYDLFISGNDKKDCIEAIQKDLDIELPDFGKTNDIQVGRNGFMQSSSLFNIFVDRNGQQHCVSPFNLSHIDSDASEIKYLPNDIVGLFCLNSDVIFRHFEVARKNLEKAGYYEDLTPDKRRKIHKEDINENNMSILFDGFSEKIAKHLEDYSYIPLDNFPYREQMGLDTDISYIAVSGDNSVNLAAIDCSGEVVGMVYEGNRYVIPEMRGRGIGVGLVIVDEMFPGLGAMKDKNGEHSYTPGGLASREKAIAMIKNAITDRKITQSLCPF